jgi:hypothetical protein
MELSISKMKFHLDQSQMLGAYLPTLIAMAKYKTYFDKPAQAKAALLALTYHSPNHFSARLNAAKLYIQLGEFELAEQNLQAAQRFVSHNSKMAAETEYLRRQLQQL